MFSSTGSSVGGLFLFAGVVALAFGQARQWWGDEETQTSQVVSMAREAEASQFDEPAETETPARREASTLQPEPPQDELQRKRNIAAARLQAIARVRLGKRGGRHQKLGQDETDDVEL